MSVAMLPISLITLVIVRDLAKKILHARHIKARDLN